MSTTQTTTGLRLTGTLAEIDLILVALKDRGFDWESNNRYYPQRGDTRKFSYYLNNLRVLQPQQRTIAQSDDPQPRPWDAVIGGKGQK